MPGRDLTLWTFFVAGGLSVAIALAAVLGALLIAQHRRIALERDHARRIFTAQEEERSRVARELHDDALQRVAVIRNELDGLSAAARTHPPEEQARRLAAVAGELEDLGIMLRNAAHQLHPSIVEKVGLARALESLAAEFQRSFGLQVSVTVSPGQVRLSPESSVSAYRIAQEALRNVVKHAGVGAATVTLSAANGEVTLMVSDAGLGFEPAARHDAAGLGLIAMGQRAALTRGKLTIASRPGTGTTVTAVLPCRKES